MLPRRAVSLTEWTAAPACRASQCPACKGTMAGASRAQSQSPALP